MTRIHRQYAGRQRGAASVIVSVLFLVIVGYGAVVMLDMGAGEMHDANLGDADMQAQLLAEAGLEREFYRFRKGGVGCVALLPNGGPYNLGNGSFSLDSAVLENSNCRIKVTGTVGEVKATAEGVSKPSSILDEPMDYSGTGNAAGEFLATWTVTLTSTQGSTTWDSGNNCTACTGSLGGSFYMRTNTNSRNELLEGYADRALPTSLVTTAGMTITTYAGYRKQNSGGTPDFQELSVWLYNSAVPSLEEEVWTHSGAPDSTGWWTQTSLTILAAGRTYDRVKIKFKLDEPNTNGNNQIRMWIDEIRISL